MAPIFDHLTKFRGGQPMDLVDYVAERKKAIDISGKTLRPGLTYTQAGP